MFEIENKLGDFFRIKHGYAFKGEFFAEDGPYIVLTPGNFNEKGGFKLKSKEKYYIGNVPKDFILSKNDLIVAMTEQAEGLLGSSALIPKSNYFLHNQRLSQQIIKKIKTLKPYKNTMMTFNETILPVMELCRTLQQKNANLRKARDLLLPKLISGELDVDGLDIKIEESP